VDHVLPDPTARYVRLWITRTKRSASGKYTAQVAEVEIVEDSAGAAVTLEWTAPGDDGNTGTAAAYDLRCWPRRSGRLRPRYADRSCR
jgi:hypothetical protein